MAKGQNHKPRPRVALTRGAVVALACMVVAAAWGASRSVKPGPKRLVVRMRPAAIGKAKVGAALQSPPASKAVWRYDAVTKRNLFMPVAQGSQGAGPALAPLPPVSPMPVEAFQQRPLGAADSTPAPPPWVYAGYATVDGDLVAILENTATKRAEFTAVGQSLDGMVVRGISPQAVQLADGDKVTELKISETFTATPLNEPPKPAAQPGTGQGRRGRGNLPGGGGGGAQFFQRLMPALQNNPDLANQISNLLQGSGGPGRPGGG